MRARNIKPGFFQNDELAELLPLTRILFAGLWCLADRSGRLEDRPKRIHAEVLPYDDCDTDNMLDTLAKHNFIIRYEVEGQKYIQIPQFKRHQNPHKNEAPSIIPGKNGISEELESTPIESFSDDEQDLHCTSTVHEQELHSTSIVLVQKLHGSRPADSLIPDSHITPTPLQGDSPQKKKRKPKAESIDPAANGKTELFLDVWLKAAEWEKLIAAHGEPAARWMVEKLSAYKLSKGKVYASDYGAILNWVVDEYRKVQPKLPMAGTGANSVLFPASRYADLSVPDIPVAKCRDGPEDKAKRWIEVGGSP